MKEYLGEYKGKTILITGGAGCVGSNLAKALIEEKAAKIIALDDLSSAKEWNIPTTSSIVFIEGSILDEEALKKAFSQNPDYVFHLAAHFANQNSVDNPETDLLVNGLGTLKVLRYSRQASIRRFIFASSGCSVYGSEAPLPLKEDFISLHLDTPYQVTKLLGELYCNFFHNYYNLPIAICRYFNVYGPGEIPGKYRNVIPNFIWLALHNKPLPITGSGEETRDFTFVDDIVEGTLLVGTMPEAIGEAFNLASETEAKVADIANIINRITANRNGVEFVARRDWDRITRRRASIRKARSVLGYEPKTEIEEGIKKVRDWIVKNRTKIENEAKF
ncbi:NAD-dependent epimerase/dehydratase family protein [Chloroflexota bacterium]